MIRRFKVGDIVNSDDIRSMCGQCYWTSFEVTHAWDETLSETGYMLKCRDCGFEFYYYEKNSSHNVNPTFAQDKTFINIADELATFSKCQFTKVACIIVNERGRIISTGVNGTIPGYENCCEHQFNDRDDHKAYSDRYEIHAEMNAILEMIKNKSNSGKELSFYCTISPCWNCIKHIMGLHTEETKITKIVFRQKYHRTSDAELEEMKAFCKKKSTELYQL